MKPSVSVIIACYNQATLVREAIASVVAQTLPAHEIIVVDDGSSDETPKVLTQVQAEFSNAPLTIIHQANAGVAAARNAGAHASSGTYIVFLDGDDALTPTYLEQTVAAAVAHPDAAYVYTDYEYIGTQTGIQLTKDFSDWELLFKNFITVTCLMRRDAFEQVGGFTSELHDIGYEDWDFFLTALEHDLRGYHVPQALFQYRQHITSRNVTAARSMDGLKAIRARHPKLFDLRYFLSYYARVAQAMLRVRKKTS